MSLMTLLLVPLFTAQDAPKGPDRWEKEIQAIEKRDADKPPPDGAVVFVGSSSIRLWDLAKSFPGQKVVNHGFGGSQIADSTHFANRLVTKLKPKLVVFYAGDNDIAAGRTPEQVLADFRAFVGVVHKELPKTRVLFVSIKPSVARWKMFETQTKANALVEEYCKKDDRLGYVDVVKPMLGRDGQPRPELFVKDGLHMTEEGYKSWAAALQPLIAVTSASSP